MTVLCVASHGKNYPECNKWYIVREMLARYVIKLDRKTVELDGYMQILTHFTVSKNEIKFLWGRLGGIAPQLFGRGGDRPHRPDGVGAYD